MPKKPTAQALLGTLTLLAASTAGAQAPAAAPPAAAFQTTIGTLNPVAVMFFILFAISTLCITYWAAKRTRTTKEFYAAGRSVTAMQNGLALAGDYMSAASFLGIAGLVSTKGYDGLIYSVGWLVGWPIITFLIAEPLRNLGKYTFSDVVAFRLTARPIRAAAAFGSLITVIFYLIAQMVGAGTLFRLMFNLPFELALLLVGVLMISYVLFGGMIATTWVQIIKAVLLLGGATLLVVLVLNRFGFSYGALFGEAARLQGEGEREGVERVGVHDAGLEDLLAVELLALAEERPVAEAEARAHEDHQERRAAEEEHGLDDLDPGRGDHAAEEHVGDHQHADEDERGFEGEAEHQPEERPGADHLRDQVEEHRDERAEGGGGADRPRLQAVGHDVGEGVLAEVAQRLGDQEHDDRPADEPAHGVDQAVVALCRDDARDPEEGGGAHVVAGEGQPVLEAGDAAAGGVELLGGAGALRRPVGDAEGADDEEDEEDDGDGIQRPDGGLHGCSLRHRHTPIWSLTFFTRPS